jgi:hypothetical protein
MDDLYEAIEPELSDEELEAEYVDHLLQTAPPIVWECCFERDNECHVCREERLTMLQVDAMR